MAEKGWKPLRSIIEEKLDMACARIPADTGSIIAGKGRENHKTYLEVWKTVQSGDSETAEMIQGEAMLSTKQPPGNGMICRQKVNWAGFLKKPDEQLR